MTNEQTIDEIMALASEVEDQGLIHACGEGAEPIAERDALRHAITAALAAKDAALAVMEAESAAMADALKQIAETVGLGVGHTAAEIITALSARPAPGEWIEWAGGECPIADGVGFQFKFRDDSQNKENVHYKATEWDWSDCAADADIVAYRVLA